MACGMANRPSHERLVWAQRIVVTVLAVVAIFAGLYALEIRGWLSNAAHGVGLVGQQTEAIYLGLADWRSQLAAIVLLLDAALSASLVVVLRMLRAGRARERQAKVDKGAAESERDRAWTVAKAERDIAVTE